MNNDANTTTSTTSTTSTNNIYLRAAVILLAINFIVNGYFVYTVLKVSEMNQDSNAAIKTVVKK